MSLSKKIAERYLNKTSTGKLNYLVSLKKMPNSRQVSVVFLGVFSEKLLPLYEVRTYGAMLYQFAYGMSSEFESLLKWKLYSYLD